ncbi:MAG: AlpA family transcriptional regulator [Alphaproteobacteria bacterium]
MTAKILKLPEVIKTTGLGRSSIYAFIKSGKFPPPVPLGDKAVGWLDSEVFAWINSRADLRNALQGVAR